MLFFRLCYLSVLLTACIYPYSGPVYIDGGLIDDYNYFVEQAEHYGIDLDTSKLSTVRYGIQPFGVWGQCRVYKHEGEVIEKRILIKPGLSATHQRAVLVHELGHCVLGLRHERQGIMRFNIGQESEYKSNWKKIMKDLFLR